MNSSIDVIRKKSKIWFHMPEAIFYFALCLCSLCCPAQLEWPKYLAVLLAYRVDTPPTQSFGLVINTHGKGSL